jgi:hypothetical protein
MKMEQIIRSFPTRKEAEKFYVQYASGFDKTPENLVISISANDETNYCSYTYHVGFKEQ